MRWLFPQASTSNVSGMPHDSLPEEWGHNGVVVAPASPLTPELMYWPGRALRRSPSPHLFGMPDGGSGRQAGRHPHLVRRSRSIIPSSISCSRPPCRNRKAAHQRAWMCP